MNKMMLLAVVCCTFVSLASGQTVRDQTLLRQKDATAKRLQQPEKPKFTPELARLSFLAGTFNVALTQYENPMGHAGTGKGYNTARWELDSLVLIMDHEDRNPDGQYRGHGVFSYDPTGNQYKCWWFNNWGGTTEYKGGFTGDTLTLSAEIPGTNGTMPMKLQWYPEGKNVGFRIFTDFGKGEVLLMESTSIPVRKGPTGLRKH